MRAAPSPTFRTLLEARAAELPGRDRERAALAALARDELPLVAIVHGIAGVGKSALLRAAAHDARERGATAVLLDGRAIEPTEHGFLAALGSALGEDVHSAGDAAAALAAAPGRVVVLLDAYERLQLLDSWLRLVLVPALPASVRLVLADRGVPTAWTREFGDLVLLLRLGNLERDAAREVLARAGVADGARADAIDRVVRGHPMTLQMAAAAMPDGGAMTPALEALACRYLDGLDARTRRALQAACVVRRATISLLAVLVPEQPAADAFAALEALPFAQVGPDGLIVDDAVREATAALLRATDPVTYRRHRVAAWQQLRRELRDAASADLWRYTADMLHLVEHPVVRDAFFPSGAERYVVEPARGDDGDAIAAIARAHLPPPAAERLLAYWAAAPGTFRVSRDAGGSVAAFASIFELEDVSSALLARDPVALAWREHRRRDPLSRGAARPASRGTSSRARAGPRRRWPRPRCGSTPSATTSSCARRCGASTSPRTTPPRSRPRSRRSASPRWTAARWSSTASRSRSCSMTWDRPPSTAGSATWWGASCRRRRTACSTRPAAGWCSTGATST